MCILVVEDEPIILMISQESLSNAGYDVMTACNATEALELLRSKPGHFTCLVTDYLMAPGGTGADVVEHARRTYASMPVVLATATGGAVTAEWRHRHRVELLHKPFGPEALVTTVRRLLDQVVR